MSDILKDDRRYTWHPFTQHQTEREPVVITSAKGASLYDENGNEILDLISSWWTCLHGHAHPALNQALADQAQKMEHIMFAGFTHAPAVQLAKRLTKLLPGDLNRVFFSDNGSTAVEVALKLSYQYWKNRGEDGRKTFFAFEGAYHGDTVGAMSVGKGSGFFKIYNELQFTVETLPYADTWDGDVDIEEKESKTLLIIKNMIADKKNQIAGLIIEPLVQGAGGMRMCRPEFIKTVSDLARENNILVIYDEVAVGFGRTGTMFACQKIGFMPDFICLSKGLTGGYMPMSVTVATDRVFNEFLGDSFKKAFVHGHSFTANPLACAVALKSLDLFQEENVLQKISHIEKKHSEFINELKSFPVFFKPRVMGSIVAFNISSGGDGYKTGGGEFMRDWFLNNGLNIRPLGNVVYLMPPYCITDAELDRAYAGIYQCLSELMRRAA